MTDSKEDVLGRIRFVEERVAELQRYHDISVRTGDPLMIEWTEGPLERAKYRLDELLEIQQGSEEGPDTYTVAVYELGRGYGGDEEGGWYYNYGTRVTDPKEFATEGEAQRYAGRMNGKLAFKRRKYNAIPLGYSTYDGGHFDARVHEGVAPDDFNDWRPYC